jgi:hypothetical protein
MTVLGTDVGMDGHSPCIGGIGLLPVHTTRWDRGVQKNTLI